MFSEGLLYQHSHQNSCQEALKFKTSAREAEVKDGSVADSLTKCQQKDQGKREAGGGASRQSSKKRHLPQRQKHNASGFTTKFSGRWILMRSDLITR